MSGARLREWTGECCVEQAGAPTVTADLSRPPVLADRAELVARLSRLRTGGFVLVTAAAGFGKSRLAEGSDGRIGSSVA